ncbi:hypothetical protein [Pseudonocardia sp. DLS-67]
MVRTDRSAADDAGARELLAAALDAVAAPARRDERASTRVVRGTPRHIWDVVTGELLGRARYEYVGFDDPSVLVANGLTESMLARGSVAMREMLGRGARLRQLTTGALLAARGPGSKRGSWRLAAGGHRPHPGDEYSPSPLKSPGPGGCASRVGCRS